MKKNTRNRVLAVLLCVCMMAAMIVHTPGQVARARTSSEVEAEIAALEQKQADLQEQIDSLKAQEADQQEIYDLLCQQIAAVEEQIDACIANITELDNKIRRLDNELDAAEQEIEDTMELLKERIKALYKSGNESTLQILLGSSSWTEFAEKAELLKAVTEHDSKLIQEVSAFMESTSATREELNADRELAAQLRTDLETKQTELTALEAEAGEALDELRTQRTDLQGTHDQYESELNDLGEELEGLLQGGTWDDIESQDPVIDVPDTGAMFGWPCPGYAYISSYWGDDRGHKGIDFAAVRGTPIVAAESGTVVRAWTADEWGMGWGYHVLIKHNNTYSTLYAHASQLAVYEGQYVQRGQVIAYVGNTGNSFGNHLHFEVYQNGVRVDPAPYLGL